MDVTPNTVWVLGLPLLGAAVWTDPYWRGVFGAATTGASPVVAPGDAAPHLWRTAGMGLVLVLLVGLSDLSPEGGVFAALFLLALWALFLIHHANGLGAFFSQFTPAGR